MTRYHPPRAEAPVSLTDEDLRALPKVELHVHLEGTVSAATAAALARDHGEVPRDVLVLADHVTDDTTDDELRYPAPFVDFDQFVRCFVATSGQMRAPADLTAATAAFVAGQSAQEVVWTEATFTATTLIWQGWDPDAMWDAVADGLGDAPVGLIIDTPRNLPVQTGRDAVALAERGLARGLPIVGLGMTGPETSAPTDRFSFLGTEAQRLGLGFAVHAGETGGPSYVLDALAIGAQRIGHGVAIAQDPAVMAEVAARGVVCEVCPSSNVTLGVVSQMDAHPLAAMATAGVAVTISSDDPPFFSTTLTHELRHAERMLQLDRAGHAVLQRRAASAAFMPDSLRTTVLAAIDAWLAA
jgi:aminodeoxyfutalosine deaminase